VELSSALGQVEHDRLALLVRMQPDTEHRFAVVVEEVLAPVVGAVASFLLVALVKAKRRNS
jgi:hypothetical protein